MTSRSTRPAAPSPEVLDRHQRFMRVAIDAARKGIGRTSPNPAVGAVVVRRNAIVAVGYHRAAGADHAEVDALRKLDFSAKDCDLYVTLEPCDHVGRTGSCTDVLLSSGVRRVFVGASDPNPRVRGKGVRRLERGGIPVERGILEEECRALNEPFNVAIVKRRSFVLLKIAMSLDGRIATRTGESQWITSTEARRFAHRLRNELDAVVVGIGTVLADDPLLTARFRGARNPVRVILDSRLRIPHTSKVVATAREVPTIVATTRRASASKRRALEKRGVDVLLAGAHRVSPKTLLRRLYARGLNGVLVEGGPTVSGAFVDAGLVDKIIACVAPICIGGRDAPACIGGDGARTLACAMKLDALRVGRVGPDLMITAYPVKAR